MDILKIATSGSVDDGKSTLIGRLLYETGQIPTDKLEAIQESSKRRGLEFTDLSLLTDGLIAEREQGITIDVAHIYFRTEKRKYIIADTPGHEEYTRNMITGASGATASIILLDARKGILPQTRRHFYIAHLLNLPEVIVAVNKMDLVDFAQDRFEEIKWCVNALANHVGFSGRLHFVPVSALHGEGVASFSQKMAWFNGEPLLTLLDRIQNPKRSTNEAPRFQVQHVIRPRSAEHPDYRAYAGTLRSGKLEVGQQVRITNTGRTTTIKRIEKWGNQLKASGPDLALTIELEDDLDLRRGDMVTLKEDSTHIGSTMLRCKISWMSDIPLNVASTYTILHGTHQTKGKVSAIRGVLEIDSYDIQPKGSIGLNDVGIVDIRSAAALAVDPYTDNPKNGYFILIEPTSNATVALALVEEVLK